MLDPLSSGTSRQLNEAQPPPDTHRNMSPIMILITAINNPAQLGTPVPCFKHWSLIGLVLAFLISDHTARFTVNIFVSDLVGF